MYHRPTKKPRLQVHNDKPSYYTHCGHCGKAGGTQRLALQLWCLECDAVAYCSDECQAADCETHAPSCKWIADAHKVVLRDQQVMRRAPDNYRYEMFGIFYDHNTTRDYVNNRCHLMNVLENEATLRLKSGGSLNAIALEKALEDGLEVLSEVEFDTYCDLRHRVPKYMIELGKYQQAYDFLKFWLQREYEDLFCISSKGIRPIFLRQKDQDPFESVWDLAVVKQPDHRCVLDMALLKLTLFSNIRAAQVMEAKVGKPIASLIGSFLNVPKEVEWLDFDCADLLYQAQELFSIAYLVKPNEISWQRRYRMWTNNKVAKNFYTNFVNDTQGSLLPVEDLLVEDE